MTMQAKTLIAALAGAVGVFGILFAVAAVDAWGGDMHDDDGDAYMGMMGDIGDMDSDAFMGHMQGMMDGDSMAAMTSHMDNHESMPTNSEMDADQMMHQMMDGMMDHMMSGRGGNHHAAGTPTN